MQASNIRKGASILGVSGYFSDGTNLGGNSAAGTANIMSGYSAFINGARVDGSLVINNFYTGASEPSSDLGNNGDIYLKR